MIQEFLTHYIVLRGAVSFLYRICASNLHTASVSPMILTQLLLEISTLRHSIFNLSSIFFFPVIFTSVVFLYFSYKFTYEQRKIFTYS